MPVPRLINATLRTLTACLGLCALAIASSSAAETFTDDTASSGISVWTKGAMNDFGSGVAFLDYDNDRDLDLYVVMDNGVANKLYRNNGGGTFTDVAAVAGVGDTLWGKGVKCADYNNDGFTDIFVGNFNGPNRLFRNNGNGTFADVTQAAGLDHTGPTYGAAWGDFNNDGLLDLYVVSYYSANLMYRNLGNGVFGEEGAVLNVQDTSRPGFDAAWFDYDNDNDLDLYIINDLMTGNVLYRNDKGVFTDVSTSSGAGVNIAAMGIALSDYDRNGYMDVYITNTPEGNVFLHNNGDGTFTDVAKTLQVRVNRVGWGTAFFDYDNDGDEDLYVVNFDMMPGTEASGNVLFENNGGTFTDITATSGAGDRGPGFGLAVGDYNEDGCSDLFVHNRNAPSVLLGNTPNTNNWLKIRTVGIRSNRDGIGARIRAVAGSLSQIKDVSGGMSYLSQHSPLVSFGVGPYTSVDLTITWPSGRVDVVDDVAVNQTVTVVEGIGIGEPGTFVEASNRLGIDVSTSGERDTWGHGAAFVDVDGDGQLELYVIMENNEPNRLYRYNDVSSRFEEIGVSAGCADVLDGRAVTFADYDNDGDPDLFVANDRSPDKLYRNDGSGSFVDVSSFAGVDYIGRSHSAAWGDYNNDGDLDLYVCSYGTQALPLPNRLYKSNGDGTFAEVAEAAGVASPDIPALAVVWIDIDDDNDLDLYIANDKMAGNTMYRNNDDGTFTDVSVASGTDLVMNAMGIAVADYDHNGYLDMYISNTPHGNALLRNNGDGTFTDVAVSLGVAVGRIGWGNAFFDYDNDGDDDLYQVNWTFNGGPNGGNVFFENRGGSFTDISDDLGVGDESPGYGLTVGDYNNDGYVDMFVNNQSSDGSVRSVFYESVPLTNHWIKIKTVGTVSNRDGVGAKIRIAAAGSQIKDVRAGSSYLSQLSPEVEFGLGSAATVSSIAIAWPSGTVDVFNNVAADKFYEAHEGESELRLVPMVSVTFFEAVAVGGGEVELRWTVNSNQVIDGFRVYRREPGGAEEVLTSTDLGPTEQTYIDTSVQPGTTYEYRMGIVLQDGTEKSSQRITQITPSLETALGQNHPNPFNPLTKIQFSLAEAGHVELKVYDALGRHVVTLVDGPRLIGPQTVSWNGTNAAGHKVGSGVYFYQLKTTRETLSRKMVLIK